MTPPEPHFPDTCSQVLVSGQLRYLGQMSANLSHELRNGLAIINEKNGLIADMMAMAARGRPPNEARLTQLAADVARLVKNASEVCDRLSQLAHTTDAPTRVVELGTTVELVTCLIRRQARRSGVALEIEPADPVNVDIEPVLLQLVISLCLAWSLGRDSIDKVHIAVERTGRSTAAVRFVGPRWQELLTEPPELLAQALRAIGGEIEAGETEAELLLLIPTIQKEELVDAAAPGEREGKGRP